MKGMLDIYSGYLLASFSQTSATTLSRLMNAEINHDQATRFLSQEKQTSKDLWLIVKPLIRQIEADEGVLLIDDSIEEKPYTDENDIIAWHFDHSKNRSVKGISFVSTLYQNGDLAFPIGFRLVAKTEKYIDKNGKEKRRSLISKNEMAIEMIKQALKNQVRFKFVLFDVWFASSENMMTIKDETKRDFICPVKANRKVADSLEDKLSGSWKKVETIDIEQDTVRKIYLEAVDFPVLLTNKSSQTKMAQAVFCIWFQVPPRFPITK